MDICTRAPACCCPCGPQGGSKHRTVPGGGANVQPGSPSCLNLLCCVATDMALGLSGPLLLDPLGKLGVRTKTEASQFCPERIKGSGLHQARVGCGEWRSWCCLCPVLCWSFKQSCFRPAPVCEPQGKAVHLSKAARILDFAQVVQAGGGSGLWSHTATGGGGGGQVLPHGQLPPTKP